MEDPYSGHKMTLPNRETVRSEREFITEFSKLRDRVTIDTNEQTMYTV